MWQKTFKKGEDKEHRAAVLYPRDWEWGENGPTPF